MILVLEIVIAGLVGTSCMSLTMTVIHRAEWANADMIRALGSCVTRSSERALGWGLLIHLTAGMVLAVPYVAVLGALAGAGSLMTLGLGTLMGLGHGLVMALLLLAIVSEKHPLPQFQEAGFEVGVAHILGHVAYGIGVAFVVQVLGIDLGLHI